MSMRPEGMYAVHPIVAGDRWCGEFAPLAAKLRICRNEEANAAFDAASRHDATDAPLGASECECDRLPE